MGYPDKGTHLNYFVPVVALATTDVGVMHSIDIGATGADHGELLCVRPCSVVQCGFSLTEEAASGTSAAPTVLFKKRPTYASATGESTVSTVTVASGAAVGSTTYENCTPVKFAVGDTMEVSHTVGTGTPTGIGVYYFICVDDEEVPANNTEMAAG